MGDHLSQFTEHTARAFVAHPRLFMLGWPSPEDQAAGICLLQEAAHAAGWTDGGLGEYLRQLGRPSLEGLSRPEVSAIIEFLREHVQLGGRDAEAECRG